MEDHTLLERYARNGDEAAFAALVRRHAGMVLSVAWRRTGSRALAEEAAQNVFTLLARKAREGGVSLEVRVSGWLHAAALRVASRHSRTEENHRRRVQRFALAGGAGFEEEPPDAPEFAELLPFPDAALERLPAADRDVLLLRFYENRTLRETGERLGKSESATLRHVNRALSRLGAALRRYNRSSPAITLSAAALASLLGAGSTESAAGGVPGAAVNSLTESALASASSGAGISFWTSAAVFMSKTKTFLTSAAVVLLCLLPPVVLRRQGLELRARLEALNPDNAPAVRPAVGAKASPLSVNHTAAAASAALDPNAPRRYFLTQQMVKDMATVLDEGLELSEIIQTLLRLTPEETRAANAVILSTVQECRALQKQLAKVTERTETEFVMEILAFPEADQQRLRENLQKGLEEALGPKRAEIVVSGLTDADAAQAWKVGYFGKDACKLEVKMAGTEMVSEEVGNYTLEKDMLYIHYRDRGADLDLADPHTQEAVRHLLQIVEVP